MTIHRPQDLLHAVGFDFALLEGALHPYLAGVQVSQSSPDPDPEGDRPPDSGPRSVPVMVVQAAYEDEVLTVDIRLSYGGPLLRFHRNKEGWHAGPRTL